MVSFKKCQRDYTQKKNYNLNKELRIFSIIIIQNLTQLFIHQCILHILYVHCYIVCIT